MANAFNKQETVMFEQVLEKFDADNMTAKNCAVFRPGAELTERSNDTIWRPVPYISTTVQGRTVSDSDFTDLTQLAVPAKADITENILWNLNAWELRDPLQRERKIDSAVQQLSAVVNRSIANVVALQGSLVTTSASAASSYDDIAEAEVRMINEECDMALDRCYIANANDYKGLAGNLAGRQTMEGKPNMAYERSYVGMIAGYDTYRTSFQPTLAASAGSTTTTSAQSYVPLATQTNAVNGGESNVDNRFFDLAVTDSSSFAVGDVITISGTNAVGMINKEDLSELRTFRVTDIPDGTTLEITPPPINVTGDKPIVTGKQ